MSERLYWFANGALPTTASQVAVTTGTAIKTMLQVAPPSTGEIYVVEWGISFDGSAAATPGIVELLETDVAATVTSGSGHIVKWSDPAALASQVTVGTTSTGYTATAEGTITAVRQFDVQHLPPTAPYVKQFPLGREPRVAASKFLRVRVKFGAAINAICYVIWKEG
jgi:hypothetical protein